MRKNMLKTPIGLIAALGSSQLMAGGFALNEQSISGMGIGYAGRSSSAADASYAFNEAHQLPIVSDALTDFATEPAPADQWAQADLVVVCSGAHGRNYWAT